MPLIRQASGTSISTRHGMPCVKTNWNTSAGTWVTGNTITNTLSREAIYPWKITCTRTNGYAISGHPTRWNTRSVAMPRHNWQRPWAKQPSMTRCYITHMLTKTFLTPKQNTCARGKRTAHLWKISTRWKAGKDSKKGMPPNTRGTFRMTWKI